MDRKHCGKRRNCSTNYRHFQTERVCNSKVNENGRDFSKRVENTVGNGEIARYEQISPFPIVFSKDLYSRHVKYRACLGERVKAFVCDGL